MVGRSMYVGVLGHDARAAVRHRGRLFVVSSTSTSRPCVLTE